MHKTVRTSTISCLAFRLRYITASAEALILAQECQAERLLLDDQRAVGYARELGLNVTRTPVIYSEAKLRGWIPSVREKLDALRKKGFRLSERHYRLVLKEIGES